MKILYATTWFPYPPSFGAKIRAYHLLKSLSRKHEIALVSFADVPVQTEWLREMEHICAKVVVLPRGPFEQHPVLRKTAWLSRQPSSLRAIYSPKMMGLLLRTATEWQPDCLVAWTYITAPYVLAARQVLSKPALLDSDNLMTQMLHDHMASSRHRGQRLRRWLAWRKMMWHEGELFRHFDCTALASPRDYAAAQEMFRLPASKFAVLPNGVDLEHNRLGLAEPNPNRIVFNGAITYEANRDAVEFFVREVWPLVLQARPEMQLQVTGSTHNVDLSHFANVPNLRFTGFVDDIRTVVAGSGIAIAPLRQGGGTRLKILEAMALGTPVVSTSKGVEGLQIVDGEHALIADTARAFADAILDLRRDADLRMNIAHRARMLVEQSYGWANIGQGMSDMLESMTYHAATASARPSLRLSRPVG